MTANGPSRHSPKHGPRLNLFITKTGGVGMPSIRSCRAVASSLGLRCIARSSTVARSIPSKSMTPRGMRIVSARRRMIASAVVDLPLPVSPTTPTSSPGRTSRSTPRRIIPWPRRLATSTQRSRTARRGGVRSGAGSATLGGAATGIGAINAFLFSAAVMQRRESCQPYTGRQIIASHISCARAPDVRLDCIGECDGRRLPEEVGLVSSTSRG